MLWEIPRTFSDFYVGYGILLTVTLLVQSVFFWQLSSLAKIDAPRLRPILALFARRSFLHRRRIRICQVTYTLYRWNHRSAPKTSPSVMSAIATSPTAPTTNGLAPCLPRSRKLVLSPTPAKVRRKAQRERLPKAVNCGFVKTLSVANREISRKPSTNLGNLRHRNAPLFFTP